MSDHPEGCNQRDSNHLVPTTSTAWTKVSPGDVAGLMVVKVVPVDQSFLRQLFVF
jgi:hypothetical protein